MKKILILLVIISFTTNLFAQKIKEDKIDDFSGVRLIRTSAVGFTLTFACDVLKLVDNNITEVIFRITCRLNDLHEVKKDDKFSFKLDNGDILDLYSRSYNITNYSSYLLGNTYVNYHTLTPDYYLSKTDLIKLQTTPIVKVRMYMKGSLVEKDVKKKTAKKLLNMFNLINY